MTLIREVRLVRSPLVHAFNSRVRVRIKNDTAIGQFGALGRQMPERYSIAIFENVKRNRKERRSEERSTWIYLLYSGGSVEGTLQMKVYFLFYNYYYNSPLNIISMASKFIVSTNGNLLKIHEDHTLHVVDLKVPDLFFAFPRKRHI